MNRTIGLLGALTVAVGLISVPSERAESQAAPTTASSLQRRAPGAGQREHIAVRHRTTTLPVMNG
jgi:hypothetical protein